MLVFRPLITSGTVVPLSDLASAPHIAPARPAVRGIPHCHPAEANGISFEPPLRTVS